MRPGLTLRGYATEAWRFERSSEEETMKATHLIVLAVLVCACRVSTQARVVIDTVAVGNASNAADPTTGEAMSNEHHPPKRRGVA